MITQIYYINFVSIVWLKWKTCCTSSPHFIPNLIHLISLLLFLSSLIYNVAAIYNTEIYFANVLKFNLIFIS